MVFSTTWTSSREEKMEKRSEECVHTLIRVISREFYKIIVYIPKLIGVWDVDVPHPLEPATFPQFAGPQGLALVANVGFSKIRTTSILAKK